jgi:uncharacterized membrane protein
MRWAALRERIKGALWPLPAAAVALAVVAGYGLPLLDRALAFEDPIDDILFGWVFTGGPSAARSVLSAIATSLISVTTLLFSLTIVTLQLASSQYSPRLLQTFSRDRVVQACLAILLGTFVYALVVLRSVRSADEAAGGSFVPRISVTVAFLATLASVGALVAFLSHQTRQLRVETMMRDVHVEAAATLRRLGDRMAEEGQDDVALPGVPASAQAVCARHSGFLVQVEEAPLVDALAAAEVSVRLTARPGDPVIDGTPVAWAWTDGGPGRLDAEAVEAALEKHLTLDYERADLGDPSYGLRKLVDIAARALSPGINDPTTAVHALSHVSDLLGLAARRTHWNRSVADDHGRTRLMVPSWDLATLLDMSTTQVRHHGRDDPTVIGRLFELLAEVAWCTHSEEQREAVRRECERLVAQCRRALPVGWTPADVERHGDVVQQALERRWPRPGPGQAFGPPAT